MTNKKVLIGTVIAVIVVVVLLIGFLLFRGESSSTIDMNGYTYKINSVQQKNDVDGATKRTKNSKFIVIDMSITSETNKSVLIPAESMTLTVDDPSTDDSTTYVPDTSGIQALNKDDNSFIHGDIKKGESKNGTMVFQIEDGSGDLSNMKLNISNVEGQSPEVIEI